MEQSQIRVSVDLESQRDLGLERNIARERKVGRRTCHVRMLYVHAPLIGGKRQWTVVTQGESRRSAIQAAGRLSGHFEARDLCVPGQVLRGLRGTAYVRSTFNQRIEAGTRPQVLPEQRRPFGITDIREFHLRSRWIVRPELHVSRDAQR